MIEAFVGAEEYWDLAELGMAGDVVSFFSEVGDEGIKAGVFRDDVNVGLGLESECLADFEGENKVEGVLSSGR